MSDSLNRRKAEFKKTLDPEDSRRKREDNSSQIRKEKKADQLLAKRKVR
jgi:Importin beta binding domain